MKAAYVDELGSVENIRWGDLPQPVPGPADCLVAVDAVSLNPVDTYVRSGRFETDLPLPFVLGRDLVGTVVTAPAGGSPAIGARVWCSSLGYDGRQGSWAEFAVVPADRAYPVPDGADSRQLAALAHPATTAWLGCVGHGRVGPGEWVYIGGAAGNVGRAAVTMAAASGAHVVAGCRNEHADDVIRAGAEVTVDDRAPDLTARLASLAPGGFDLVWDTSGHHDGPLLAAITAPRARVLLTAAADPSTALPLGALYTKDVSLIGFVMSRTRTDELARAARAIADLVVRGLLTAEIAEVVPLERAQWAHAQMEAGHVRGRILLEP